MNAKPSPQRPAAPAPESENSDSPAKLITVVASAVALGVAFLLRDHPQYLAGAALVAVVAGFSFLFLQLNRHEESSDSEQEDPVIVMQKILDRNRVEYSEKMAELKKALESHKKSASAGEHTALREELSLVRKELAGLRVEMAKK